MKKATKKIYKIQEEFLKTPIDFSTIIYANFHIFFEG